MDILRRAAPTSRSRPALPRLRPTPYPSRTLEPSFLPHPPPSRRPAPQLPAELIALIIESFDINSLSKKSQLEPDWEYCRRATLYSCSLVSKSFCGPALAALYRVFWYQLRPALCKSVDTGESKERLGIYARGIHVISDTPHLADLVRKVCVRVGSQAEKERPGGILKHLSKIFGTFGRHTFIHLDLVDAKGSDVAAALDSLSASSPNVRHLDIILPDHDPLEIPEISQSLWAGIRHLTQLHTLRIHSENLMMPDEPLEHHLVNLALMVGTLYETLYDASLPSIMTSSRTSLRRLTLAESAAGDVPGLANFEQLSHLSWQGVISPESQLLTQLPTLSHLTSLDLSYAVLPPDYPFLTRLPDSIKTVTLQSAPPFAQVVDLLESDKVPSLEKLSFSPVGDDFQSWTPWALPALAGPCARRSLDWVPKPQA